MPAGPDQGHPLQEAGTDLPKAPGDSRCQAQRPHTHLNVLLEQPKNRTAGFSNLTHSTLGLGWGSAAECLTRMCEALGPILSTTYK